MSTNLCITELSLFPDISDEKSPVLSLLPFIFNVSFILRVAFLERYVIFGFSC